jgi:hypothetical protein
MLILIFYSNVFCFGEFFIPIKRNDPLIFDFYSIIYFEELYLVYYTFKNVF